MSHAIRYEAEAKFPVVTTQGRDPKAWAKRIVHRFQRGDKTLMECQINFAHEALEMPIPKLADKK